MIKNRKQLIFISEIGINHNGSIEIAKKLINQSKKINCDYVKFQIRNLKKIYHPNFLKNPINAESAHQYIFNEIKRTNLKNKNYFELCDYAKKKKLKVMITPFDTESLKVCKYKHVDAIKIGSPDFENVQLILEALKYKKPLFLSTGVSNTNEIFIVKKILARNNRYNVPITIFHCVSSYPPNEEEINLQYIKKLVSIFPNYEIGYSGHERGYLPSLASIFFGARVIERHLTLNKKFKGPDHNSSLTKKEFGELIFKSKKVFEYLKNNNTSFEKFVKTFKLLSIKSSVGKMEKNISLNSQFNKKILGKSAIYNKNFSTNKPISLKDINFVSPGKGLSGLEFYNLKKKILKKNVKKLDYVSLNDFSSSKDLLKKNDFKLINKRWGLIGRLGDFDQFINEKSDLIEIHLTWRELLQPNKIKKNYNSELIIHAPEYFDDMLVDFTSSDKKILDNSFEMMRYLEKLVDKIKNNFIYDETKAQRLFFIQADIRNKQIQM